MKLKRPADAVKDADLAIAADDDFAKAHLRRAQAHEQLGDWEEAVRGYSRVQQLDKDMAGIKDMLKRANVELKKAKRVDYYKVRFVQFCAGPMTVRCFLGSVTRCSQVQVCRAISSAECPRMGISTNGVLLCWCSCWVSIAAQGTLT
jgi:tetratricopeptide (TPR) repeat protein